MGFFDGLASGLVSGIGTLFGQSSANTQSAKNANSQMAFQERMSNTAHWRNRNDLVQSGYNPMLGYMNTASTPTGAASVAQNEIAPAITSAKEGATLSNELKRTEADIEVQNAVKQKTDADTLTSVASAAKLAAETTKIGRTAPVDKLLNRVGNQGLKILDNFGEHVNSAKKQFHKWGNDKITKPEPIKQTPQIPFGGELP